MNPYPVRTDIFGDHRTEAERRWDYIFDHFNREWLIWSDKFGDRSGREFEEREAEKRRNRVRE